MITTVSEGTSEGIYRITVGFFFFLHPCNEPVALTSTAEHKIERLRRNMKPRHWKQHQKNVQYKDVLD